MNKAVFRPTAQIIALDPDARAWRRQGRAAAQDHDDLFWHEVSCGAPPVSFVPDPANRAGRVLSEAAMVLCAAGALVFVVCACLPGGIAP